MPKGPSRKWLNKIIYGSAKCPFTPHPHSVPPSRTLVCAYPSSWQAFSSVRSSVSLSGAVKCKKQSKLIASQSEPLTQLRQRTFHTHTHTHAQRETAGQTCAMPLSIYPLKPREPNQMGQQLFSCLPACLRGCLAAWLPSDACLIRLWPSTRPL